MSVSNISSTPVFQWLQQSLSATGLTVGNQSFRGSCDSQSASDVGSLFQQTLQMMTNQTAPPTDAPQSLTVNGTQGQHHHHHHRHSGENNDPGNGSFIDQLAQSILSDLQQGNEPAASSPSASNGSGESFIDGFGSAIANVLAQYHQATDSSQTSNPSLVSSIA